jgi:hypothetical protein
MSVSRSELLRRWVSERPLQGSTVFFPPASVGITSTAYAYACSSTLWASQGGVRARAADDVAGSGPQSKNNPPSAAENLPPILTEFPLPIAPDEYTSWNAGRGAVKQPPLAIVLAAEPDDEENGSKDERPIKPILHQQPSTVRNIQQARYAGSNPIGSAAAAAASAIAALDDAVVVSSLLSDSATRSSLHTPSLLAATHAWWLCFCPKASSAAIMPVDEWIRVRVATLVFLAGESISAYNPSAQLSLLVRAAQRDFLLEADSDLFDLQSGTTRPAASVNSSASKSTAAATPGLGMPKFHRGLAQLALFFAPATPEALLAQMLTSLTCRTSELAAKEALVSATAIAAAAKVAAHSAVAPSSHISGSPKAGPIATVPSACSIFVSPFGPPAPPLSSFQSHRIWQAFPITLQTEGAVWNRAAWNDPMASGQRKTPAPLVTQILAQLLRNTKLATASSVAAAKKPRTFCITVAKRAPTATAGASVQATAPVAAAANPPPAAISPTESSIRSHLDPRMLAPLPPPLQSAAAAAIQQLTQLGTVLQKSSLSVPAAAASTPRGRAKPTRIASAQANPRETARTVMHQLCEQLSHGDAGSLEEPLAPKAAEVIAEPPMQPSPATLRPSTSPTGGTRSTVAATATAGSMSLKKAAKKKSTKRAGGLVLGRTKKDSEGTGAPGKAKESDSLEVASSLPLQRPVSCVKPAPGDDTLAFARARPITPLLVPLSRALEEEDNESDEEIATSAAASPIVAAAQTMRATHSMKMEEEKRISPSIELFNVTPPTTSSGATAGPKVEEEKRISPPLQPSNVPPPTTVRKTPFRPKTSAAEHPRTAVKMLPASQNLPPQHPPAIARVAPNPISSLGMLGTTYMFQPSAMTARPLSRRAPAPPSLIVQDVSMGTFAAGGSSTSPPVRSPVVSTPSSPSTIRTTFTPTPPSMPSPSSLHAAQSRRSVVTSVSTFGIVVPSVSPTHASSSGMITIPIVRNGRRAEMARV